MIAGTSVYAQKLWSHERIMWRKIGNHTVGHWHISVPKLYDNTYRVSVIKENTLHTFNAPFEFKVYIYIKMYYFVKKNEKFQDANNTMTKTHVTAMNHGLTKTKHCAKLECDIYTTKHLSIWQILNDRNITLEHWHHWYQICLLVPCIFDINASNAM